MLDRILPEHLDNHYRGYRVALWVFVAITVFQVALGLGHIFNSDGGAQSAANIPLDTYPDGAAQNVIAVFARMGLAQLMLGLVFVIVLARYRSMIPLMYVLVVAGYIGIFALAYFKPLSLAAPSGARLPHLAVAVLSIGGLVLSLLGSGYSKMGLTPRKNAA
jgi:hypothetical protein